MPFAGYADFGSCTHANSSKDDPSAYCGEIKHRTEEKSAPAPEEASDPIMELLQAIGATDVEFMDLGNGNMVAIATLMDDAPGDELSFYKAHAILGYIITHKAQTETGKNLEEMVLGGGDDKPDVASAAAEIVPLLASVVKHVKRRGDKWVVTDSSGKKTLGTHGSEEEANAQLRAIEANKHKMAAETILDNIISKDWKPFQGPRGGIGAYNPRTQQVEYGENAHRRVRMETHGRKVENPYVDLTELAMRLMNGQAHVEDLQDDQLLSVYNHAREMVSMGGAEPGYDELKNHLATEISSRGLTATAPE